MRKEEKVYKKTKKFFVNPAIVVDICLPEELVGFFSLRRINGRGMSRERLSGKD